MRGEFERDRFEVPVVDQSACDSAGEYHAPSGAGHSGDGRQ